MSVNGISHFYMYIVKLGVYRGISSFIIIIIILIQNIDCVYPQDMF